MDKSWGIVALHGSMSHSGWFSRLGASLEERNIGFKAIDRRGCGKKPVSEGYTDLSVWAADVVFALEQCRKRYDNVALMGWCWGARLALYTQVHHQSADCLILAAPGLATSALVDARLAATDFTNVDPERIALPFDEKDFSKNEEVREFIKNEPYKRATHSKAFFEASKNLMSAVQTLKLPDCPIYTLLASDDDIIDNSKVKDVLDGHEVDVMTGGHALILENSELVAEKFSAFLASV